MGGAWLDEHTPLRMKHSKLDQDFDGPMVNGKIIMSKASVWMVELVSYLGQESGVESMLRLP